ncbi:MAG: 2-oxoglutarate and iron-dependent oxygenase domain-containing protein [Actinomycetota bacterium]
MSTIPVVDLATWFNGEPADRAELAAEIDSTLRRLGFLVVVNHGIPQDVIDRCRAEALRFYHLPAETKASVAVGETYRGWVGPGLESNAATYGVDTPPDLKETYTYGPVDLPDERLPELAPRWFAPNVWPEAAPDFQSAGEAWWRAARDLADTLLDIFASGLGLPDDYLRERCAATTASVSVNWYWPRSVEAPIDGQFRIGPHTDFGTLTILDRQPGEGGLQVKDADGNWMDAPIVPGSLIVNTGDMMRQWTNDRWSSNEHRVLPPPASRPDEELLSLIFFHEPDYDTVIEPLPTCVDADNPARYQPITANDYLAAKMDALSVS